MRKLALVCTLTTAALALLSAGIASAAPAARPGATTGRGSTTPPYAAPNTVIVFPFENNSMQGGKELAELLAGEVKSGVSRAGAYSIGSFYPASPLVQRARTDQALTQAEVDAVIDPMKGTVDPARAANVARRMGARLALLGSIEAVEYNPAQRKADVTVTVQLLDAATGTPTKTAGVTGTATGAATSTQPQIVEEAARDAAKRALNELGLAPRPMMGGPPTTAPAPVEQKAAPRRKSSYWLPLGLLLGVIVAGVK